MNVPRSQKKTRLSSSIPYLLCDNDVRLSRHKNGEDREPDFFCRSGHIFWFETDTDNKSFGGEKSSLLTKPAVKLLAIVKLVVSSQLWWVSPIRLG